jgi:hypothetical protein
MLASLLSPHPLHGYEFSAMQCSMKGGRGQLGGRSSASQSCLPGETHRRRSTALLVRRVEGLHQVTVGITMLCSVIRRRSQDVRRYAVRRARSANQLTTTHNRSG